MNTFLILVCAVSFVSLVSANVSMNEWDKFKQRHGKNKKFDAHEDKLRYAVFKKELNRVNECNAAFNHSKISYSCALSDTADLLPHEKSKMVGTKSDILFPSKKDISDKNIISSNIAKYFLFTEDNTPVPDSFDVREKCSNCNLTRCSTAINQNLYGGCGSCYGISSVRMLQYSNCYQNKKCEMLSVQDVLDCSKTKPYENNGCDGGTAIGVLEFSRVVGISKALSYPYELNNNKDKKFECKNAKKSAQKDRLFVKTAFTVQPTAKAVKQALVKYGSLVINFYANANGYFSNLKSNPYYDGKTPKGDLDCSNDEYNHGMVVVGFKKYNGKDYWIIENSWGCDFGENGVFFMEIMEKNNRCAQFSRMMGADLIKEIKL